MARFVPFVMALVTLGVTAGAHVRSSEGESTLLSLPRKQKEGGLFLCDQVVLIGAGEHERTATL